MMPLASQYSTVQLDDIEMTMESAIEDQVDGSAAEDDSCSSSSRTTEFTIVCDSHN